MVSRAQRRGAAVAASGLLVRVSTDLQYCDDATRLLILAAVPAVFVSGCSSTINPDGAAKSVVDVVSKQTKFKPKDVSCPSGVDAEVGVEFDCQFTGPEGVEYTAHMKVTKVEGDNVEFYVDSKPS